MKTPFYKLFNSGTPEGVKKAWEKRRAGLTGMVPAPKKVGRGSWEGSTPHGTDYSIRKEDGDHVVDVFDSKKKDPNKAYLTTISEHSSPQEAAQAAHEWSKDRRDKQKNT